MPTLDRPGADSVLSDPRRLAAVRRLMAAGPRGDHLDRLTRLAASLLEAPYAQVSLLAEQQHVWSLHGGPGVDPDEGSPAADSLCTVTVQQAAPFAVEDTLLDPRARALPPVVTGGVRSYLGVPIRSSAGEVLGALCVYDDVPHTWSAQAVGILGELAQSVTAELELHALSLEAVADAARLDLALDAAEIGSFDLEADTSRLHWDDRLMALFGYDRETFSEHVDAFAARLHPDDRERVAEVIAATFASAGHLAVSYRIVVPGRGLRWIEARGRVLTDRRGRPARLLGVAYDATEVRDARDRLARVLETMTDALVVQDRDGRVTYVNHEAERILGRREDELRGALVSEALPATDAVRARLEHALLTGEAVGFVEHYPALQDGRWLEVRAVPGPEGLSLYFHDVTARQQLEQESRRVDVERQQAVVERERAYAAAEAANHRLVLLADASRELGASLQPQDVLETLSRIVVPKLGQWLAVALAAETTAMLLGRDTEAGVVQVVHVAHAHDPEPLRQLLAAFPARTDDLAGVGAVVRTGQSEWLPEVSDELLASLTDDPERLAAARRLELSSALTLPLATRGRVLGAVTVAEPAGGPVDRGLLADICQRAAVALDNALLYGAEQRTAVTLQRSLLPRDLPVVPGVAAARRYLPGATGAFVGGDWYQGVQVGDRLVLAMGDVMGHGMRSAARMGQLRAIVATLALEGHSPGALLRRLGDSCDVLLDLELATLLVASLEPSTGALTVASAGHPPPLLAPLGEEPWFVDVVPGPPIGTLPGAYEEVVVEVPVGATLVLYTDGLVEQRGEDLDEGLERLRVALRDLSLPPDAVADHVLEMMDRKAGGDDDVALLVLSRTAGLQS